MVVGAESVIGPMGYFEMEIVDERRRESGKTGRLNSGLRWLLDNTAREKLRLGARGCYIDSLEALNLNEGTIAIAIPR